MTIHQPSRTTVPTSTSPVVQVPPFRTIIWLIPAAYALHIVEETVGDFPGWVTHSVGGSFSYLGFVVNNVLFMTLLLIMVSLNWRRTTPARTMALLVWTSANLFWDGLFHLLSTPVLDVYSPGLITSALLYFPIYLLTVTAIITQHILSPRRTVVAALGGLVLFGFVVWYGLFHFAV